MADWQDALERLGEGYINAYVTAPPLESTPERQQLSTVGFPVKNIGKVPEDAQFGSEMMYHAFVAIPVAYEHRKEIAPAIKYLTKLINSMGRFGKIVFMREFPGADVIELPSGHWFPITQERKVWDGIRFLNAYNENSFYGGPEEGGWWYSLYTPIASIPFDKNDPSALLGPASTGVLDWFPGPSQFRVRDYMTRNVDADLREEGTFARPESGHRPRYE